ncbi:aconitate hydratase AcnA [Nocardioides pacificus]
MTDSFDSVRDLPGHPGVAYVSLAAARAGGAGPVDTLPSCLRVLAENLLRHEDGQTVTADHVRRLATREHGASIPFTPVRILLQDASGLPVLADMVTLQEVADELGIDPAALAPRRPLDLVVDHAIEVDVAGTSAAEVANLDLEYARHDARYRFLRWAQDRLPGLRVVPPGIGICHQLNLEVLAHVALPDPEGSLPDGRRLVVPDTLVGTDSHTTMINALGVVGWGVGGIEATSAALGQPLAIPVPEVVGVRLDGRLADGVLATDLALHLAALLRGLGVVQRMLEFHGPGLAGLSVPDRATVANMAPEYGATMAYFPPDGRTLDYLAATGRSASAVDLTRTYLTAQGMLHDPTARPPAYDDLVTVDLGTVVRTVAGPGRPHDALGLPELPGSAPGEAAADSTLPAGAVAIAAITSCTNTSNPRAMVTAGLVARRAVELGLRPPAWTKTSLTPGSRTAAELLRSSGLQDALDELGFQVAGFGCGTCMGNSGPLATGVSDEVRRTGARVAAVLSGNRNFAGRIHPDVTHSYLASPPVVVALALAGTVTTDLSTDPLGTDRDGRPVRLADLWPSEDEVDEILGAHEHETLGRSGAMTLTTARWEALDRPAAPSYDWEGETGSIRRPPFADQELRTPVAVGDILGARPLLVLGDAVTTDDISPVARIDPASAAGRWLLDRGVAPSELGTFSSRRLNHDVMLRGGFANPRLANRLTPDHPGGWTRVSSDAEPVPVHEAAATLAASGVPAVVVAGHSYGAGSARDWAAKVTRLLGVRAVLAAGFERIHRTNLVAMGVLPLEWSAPELDGSEHLDLLDVAAGLEAGPRGMVTVVLRRDGHEVACHEARIRVDTPVEAAWLRAGGVLPHLVETAHGRQSVRTV